MNSRKTRIVLSEDIMENGIYSGLSRQVALEAQMDIISNNIANMNTPGYREQNMVFTEYLAKPKGIDDPLSMVLDYGQYQKTEAGPMRQTDNPLDVALQGKGWLGVQTAEGIRYTRAGNFQLNVNGELITGRGDLVAGEGGSAITIPPNAREIKIDEKGAVSTEEGQVGRLMVVEFENDQELEAKGNGLYATEAEPLPPDHTRVMQGLIEDSNVSPVLEMSRMIEVLRNYQATQRMLQNEHDRERTMIQRLTRSG
jgi:flagellar basal-body rod protein FlgF